MEMNLPATLRRAADFMEANIRKEHGEYIRWTPWYIEAMREAAEELEHFRDLAQESTRPRYEKQGEVIV